MSYSYQNPPYLAVGGILLYHHNMRYKEMAVTNRPVNLYVMNTTGATSDWSGYGNTATINASTNYPGLTSGATARYLSNTGRMSFPTAVFRQGEEHKSFSLESWVRPYNDTNANIQLLGHDTAADGLYITGVTYHFVIKYADGTEDRVSFDNQRNEVVHVVGIKTLAKLALYINGELEAETIIPEENQGKRYLSSATALNSGAHSSGSGIMFSAMAAYDYALDAIQVDANFDAGLSTSDSDDIAYEFGGVYTAFGLPPNAIFLQTIYDDNEMWNLGQVANLAIQGDILRPLFENGVSVPGTWSTNFNIDYGEGNISGVQFDWDGSGVTVECSLNGTSWSAVSRGTNTSLISSNYDPTGKTLLVRVNFVGGVVDDQSFLNSLTITGINVLNSVQSTEGLSYSATTITPKQEMLSSLFHQDWGSNVTGTLTLTSTSSAPPKTIELWVKSSGTYTWPSGATVYVNAFETTTVPGGFWSLIHLVNSSGFTNPTQISVSGSTQIGSITVYEEAFGVDKIKSILANYNDLDVWTISETNAVALDSLSESVKIYSHEWYIQPAG